MAHTKQYRTSPGREAKVVRAFFDAVARADTGAVSALVTDEFELHLLDGRTIHREDIGQFFDELRRAGDEHWITAQDVVERGDTVFAFGHLRLPDEGIEGDATWLLEMRDGRIRCGQVHGGVGITSALVRAAAERSFEYTLTPVLVLNDDREYVDANPAACQLFAASRDQLKTLRFEDLKPTAARGRALRLWDTLLTVGEQSGSCEMVGLDGRHHEVEFRARAHFMPGRHLWVLRDVTPEAPPAPLDEPAVLTPREREIMGHLARGRTGEEIAKAIYLSPHTVRTHIRNAIEKLGMHTRVGAVVKALQVGEIGLESSLSVSIGEGGGSRVRIAPSGVLDFDTGDEFLSVMREQLARGPVLLDLRHVTLMDSSGVRALNTVLKDCSQNGWSLLVAFDMPNTVRQVLDLAGVLASLPIEPDEQRAS